MQAEHFAGRLKELREAAGLTQKQLAEKAGVSPRTISSLEQGVYDATWTTAVALANALGVTCDAFARPAVERPAQGPGRPPKVKPDPVSRARRSLKKVED